MQFSEGYHTYYIYIITNNLRLRLSQHAENITASNKTFASKYKTEFLLYYEKFTWIQEAIGREKEIKGWTRDKKLELIKTINPDLDFLNYLFS